jgi:hypothetical protein
VNHALSDGTTRTGHIGSAVQAMREGVRATTGAPHVVDALILEVLAALKVLDPDHKQPHLDDLARVIAEQRAEDRATKAGMAWGRLSAMRTRNVSGGAPVR